MHLAALFLDKSQLLIVINGDAHCWASLCFPASRRSDGDCKTGPRMVMLHCYPAALPWPCLPVSHTSGDFASCFGVPEPPPVHKPTLQGPPEENHRDRFGQHCSGWWCWMQLASFWTPTHMALPSASPSEPSHQTSPSLLPMPWCPSHGPPFCSPCTRGSLGCRMFLFLSVPLSLYALP